MLAKYQATNRLDDNGNPAGGEATGTGIRIAWQNGPLGRHSPSCVEGKPCTVESGCTRIDPNGAFVETVIDIARQRIQFYQDTKFSCSENAIAITKLEEALLWLNKRTTDREARKVEGTHNK